MKRKPCYFKKGDIIIYSLLSLFFFFAVKYALGIEAVKGNKIEIYVDNQLKYVYPLEEKKKEYFVDTNLGGVNVLVEKMKVRVTSGNKIEIYVDNQLKYVYPLEEKKKEYFVDTNLGGVNVLVEKMKVRVTSSNSPLKICVKQGC